MAEPVVKAAVIYDTSQMQQGVQESVDGLKQMAAQASVTSQEMVSKSQAMAQAAQAAAGTITQADLAIASSTKLAASAKSELLKAQRDVKLGAGAEADALTLLAVAQRNSRAASQSLAASQQELAKSEAAKAVADQARAVSAAAQASAGSLSQVQLRVASASRAAAVAQLELREAQELVRNGALSEAEAVTVLAVAQRGASEATAELAVAEKELEATTHEGGSAEFFSHLKESLIGLGEALAVAEVVNKLRESASEALEFGEQIQRASEKTGLSVATLSTLHYAASVTGGDFDGMTAAVSKMDKAIGAASEGDKKATSFLKALGLNATELAGSSDGAEVAFRKFASTLAATENPIRRVELATGLLGKAGAEQIPTLIQLGNNWDTFRQHAQDAGVQLDGETAEQLEATKQRLADLQQHILGAGVSFSEGFTPSLARMISIASGGKSQMDAMNEWGQALGKTFAFTAEVLYSAASAAEFLFSASEGGKLTEAGRRDMEAAKELQKQAQEFHDAAFAKAGSVPAASAIFKGAPGGQSFEGTGGASGVDAERKADEERFKQDEAKLAELKALGPVTAAAEREFWEQAIGGFKAGSDKYREILQREGALTQEILKSFHEKVLSLEKKNTESNTEESATLLKSSEGMERWSKSIQENLSETGEHWEAYHREVAKSEEIAAQIADSNALAKVKAEETAGGITKLAAAQQVAAIHATAYARELKVLEEELARLQKLADAGGKNPITGQTTDPKLAAQIQSVQNQIEQSQGKGAAQNTGDQAAISAQIAKPYLTAFDSINQGWLKVQNDLIQGNNHIGQDFARMGLQLVQQEAANAEKMLAAFVRTEIQKRAARATTTQAGVATDAAGAAQSDTISALSALKQANHAAAVAAGKAWSAMADIPIVGPELGAIAAAATYAGVMALAAFEQGGIVAGSPTMGVPILAHGGERVLSYSQTQTFERMVNGGGASGNKSLSIHMGDTTVHGGGGANLASQIMANKRDVARSLKSLHREGHLDFLHG